MGDWVGVICNFLILAHYKNPYHSTSNLNVDLNGWSREFLLWRFIKLEKIRKQTRKSFYRHGGPRAAIGNFEKSFRVST